MKSLSHVRHLATPWTVAYHAPPSMGVSRQEYWSVLPFPSPEDLPNPELGRFKILNSFKFSLNFDTAYGSTFAYWIYVNMSATDLWERFISFSGLWKSYHSSQDHPLFLAALGSCDLAVFYREHWSTYFKVSHGRDQLNILTA